MGSALKINNTNPVSLKEMSGTDFDYSTNLILSKFAASNTGVGTVSINPATTAGLTSIGTFTDTYRNFAVGTHPAANTITTANTYTAYQDLQSATESLTRPVDISSLTIKEQDDTNLNSDIIAIALANLVANGVGSYALSGSAPTGGTWTSQYTIIDTVNPSTTTAAYLWRKTAAASVPSVVRPMKINASSPISLREMSDVEIESLTERLRNRIVATGIANYRLQSTSPVGGTWVTQGTILTDTRNTLTNQNYSGNYTGTYSRGFTGSYRLFYAGFGGTLFSGTYTGFFSGTYTGTYTGATINAATESISSVYLWVRTS